MKSVRLLLIAAVVVGLLVVAGCKRDPAYDHPAAKTIESLLKLRADDVRDVKKYKPYFEEGSALATALADASSEETGAPRVPDWRRPYVSEASETTASVVVVWKDADDFKDWPKVTVFLTRHAEDRWVVVDAMEATTAPKPYEGDKR